MPIYVPGKVVLAQTYVGIDDPDAAVYIAAVEAADGQSLETATKVAIHSFVKGCKADGIWPAIKASCILAGARTLTGALVPLVGTAPTNNNFVSGDYNRETGLVGNGSTKYLNSNRNNNTDPQNSKHISVYKSQVGIATQTDTGALPSSGLGRTGLELNIGPTQEVYANSVNTALVAGGLTIGFLGTSRSGASVITARNANVNYSGTVASTTPYNGNIFVFNRNLDGSPNRYIDSRLAFYSIGESLDLALLDARVTALINAFAAAIP
jgi:hypothetical protein